MAGEHDRAVSHRQTAPAPASAWFVRWMVCLGPSASVLDLACGRGRHAAAAIARGARVVCADRDPLALAGLPEGAHAVCADLEADPWPAQLDPPGGFDAILVANYLFRPRLDLLPSRLAAGGLLLYETFGAGNARYGRPANPDFLLRPGELFMLCQRHGLMVLAYESGYVPRAGGGAIVQRIAAVRPPFEPERFPLEAGGSAADAVG